MATKWISPTWRMPEESNQSKVDNYSLDFDGSSTYIETTENVLMDGGTEASISVWLNTNDKTQTQIIVSTFDGKKYVEMSLISGGLYCWLGDGSTTSNYNIVNSTNLNIDNDTWYNFTLVYDGSQSTDGTRLKVYKNGSLLTWSTIRTIPTTLANDLTTNFYIGARNGASIFEGKITGVSLYDSALSATQITALFNSGTPVNPMALTPLPKAYYPLGGGSTGSAKDQSPNPNTLTVPNESVPSATVFNFVSADGDRILCSPTTIAGTGPINGINGAITISIWLNSTQASVNAYPINRDFSGSSDWRFRQRSDTNLFQLYLTNTSSAVLDVELTGSTDPEGNPYIVVNDGKWHHIVGIYNGTDTAELYTDGVLQGSATSAGFGTLNTGSRTVIGGANNSAGNPYAGSGAWDGDLSNAQIWNTNLSSAEVVTLYNNGVPLLSGTQPEAANLKGWWKMNVDTSTWNGSDWIIGNSTANYTTALDFPGATQRIGLTSAADLGINSTISVWLNVDQVFALVNDIVLGYDAEMPLYINNNNIYVDIAGAFKPFTPNSMVKGRWYNITIVRTGDSVEVFQDGESLGTQTGYGTAVNTYLNYIGSRRFGGFGFDGKISNVSVFNSSLSSAQVETLYNNGTPETSISHSPTGWWKLDNTTTGIQDSVGSNNGTITGSVTQVNSFVSTLNGLSSGMTTANLVTSDLTRSIPYSSYSMVFDGLNDHIDFTEVDLGLNSTISFWINPEVTLSSEIIIGSGGASSYLLYSQATLLYVKIGSISKTFTHSMAANNWYNITIVRTGDSIEVFQNATSLGTQTGYGTANNTLFDSIGARANGNLPFRGKLSNMSGFNFALTEDQVLTIYNGGVPNSISSLSPVSWWSLAGDSYYNGNDWICPDLGSTSNNGTSDSMGGTELVGNGPGSTANGVATSMNIPENLQGNAPNSSKNAFSVNMTEIDRVSGSGNVPG